MFFYIKISSKDKKSLNSFLKFFIIIKKKIPYLTIKNFPQLNKKNFITVLKSPHVNKSAQEQFEFKFYSKGFLISTINYKKFIYVLKKLKSPLFPGIKLETQLVLNQNFYTKYLSNNINPDKIKLNFFKNYFKIKNLKNYCQIFDSYGEFSLKKLKIF